MTTGFRAYRERKPVVIGGCERSYRTIYPRGRTVNEAVPEHVRIR
jgi:hypothetical protein